MMHEAPQGVPDDRNDGGDNGDNGDNGGDGASEPGWSRELSERLRLVRSAAPVAQLFMRAHAIGLALEQMMQVAQALQRVNRAIAPAFPTYVTKFWLRMATRFLRYATRSMDREREAMRRDIREAMGWPQQPRPPHPSMRPGRGAQ